LNPGLVGTVKWELHESDKS